MLYSVWLGFDKNEKDSPKPIFAAIVTKVGHDKRGNVTFKRDNDGNEILRSKKEVVKKDSNGKIVEAELTVKEKIVDDENGSTSQEGLLWKMCRTKIMGHDILVHFLPNWNDSLG